MSHPTDRIDKALSTRTTIQTTFDMALDVIRRGIPGDFVECGVFAGSQCAAMALAIMHGYESGPEFAKQIAIMHGYSAGPEPPKRIERRVHLFDSFEGIPAAGEYDRDFAAGNHPVGQSACSMQQVQRNMEEWGIPEPLLVFHPGWFGSVLSIARFQDGRDHLGLREIALLRLDGDLYVSTKVCLEYLYPLLSPGGWLIVDDFGLDGCRKAVLDYFAPSAPWPLYFQKP